MSHEVLGATSIQVVLQYSDINENLPFHSLFEVLFDLWQTITAMMTDHVSNIKAALDPCSLIN